MSTAYEGQSVKALKKESSTPFKRRFVAWVFNKIPYEVYAQSKTLHLLRLYFDRTL